MLALGIRYLNGFVAASEADSHDRPEWPPHPARIFMALASAHFETGGEPVEREALEWLESLDEPPHIRAGDASPRAVVTHYVPVNDRVGPAKAILQSAQALTRDRQPRTFARAWLEDEVVHVYWTHAEPPAHLRTALEQLCRKVTRIGHSASLVQVWLASPTEVGEPTWVVDRDRPEAHLRIAGPGTLEYLEDCYNGEEVERWGALLLRTAEGADATRQKPAKGALPNTRLPKATPVRRRPELRLCEGYARPRSNEKRAAAPGTVFSPQLVVRTLERESGPNSALDLLCAPQVAGRWRDAILAHLEGMSEMARQVISGHDRAGRALQEPHLAFAPLAFVGHPHADGHLVGMGIVMPEAIEAEVRRDVLRALGRVERLVLGHLGVWRVGGVGPADPRSSLRPPTWTAHPHGATHWASITPVVFDRHSKESGASHYRQEVAEMIAQACVRVGLPPPRDVIVTAVSAHLGVPPAHAFPRLERKDGSRRRHAHAILVFDKPVRGPLLLGAGRYRGYGVCRPLDAEEALA